MNKKKWLRKFAGKDSRRWLKRHSAKYSAPQLNENWETKVTAVILKYPSLKRKASQLHQEIRRYAFDSRPVELTLTWSLPWNEQKVLDAVEAACMEMRHIPHGSTAMKIVKYRYWNGIMPTPSLRDAAAALNSTYGRARQLERTFKGAVARHLGHKIKKGCDGIAR